MVELHRTVRFSVENGDFPDGDSNGFGGVPAMRGLGRSYSVEVVCGGEPDASTGYLINIKTIDDAVRRTIVPALREACAGPETPESAEVLPRLVELIVPEIPASVRRIALFLSPTYCVEMEVDDMSHVALRQKFEFAAAHRLHVASLSDEENRRLFGKCNNPNGHGHNYVLETRVRMTLSPAGRQPITLLDIERLTEESVIEPLDHKHLNLEVPEFGGGGSPSDEPLNPSVENIARVCFDRLSPHISAFSDQAMLESVTVWETDRTSSTYPA